MSGFNDVKDPGFDDDEENKEDEAID